MQPKSRGQKLKKYRLSKGMSQLELETEIQAAAGCVSRFENNKVNPTKETIWDIAEALDLRAFELADLFSIDLKEIENENAVKNFRKIIISNMTVKPITDKVVNQMAREVLNQIESQMGYIGASISLVDEVTQTIKLFCLSDSFVSKISKFIFSQNVYNPVALKPLQTKTLEAIAESKTMIGDKLEEFIAPPLSERAAKWLQKILRIRSAVAIPLKNNGQVEAVFNFATRSKAADISKDELKTLSLFTDRLRNILDIIKI